jgi:hypothetical protein
MSQSLRHNKLVEWTFIGLIGIGLASILSKGNVKSNEKSNKEAVKQEYNQMFLKESLTAEDTLKFYEEHGLMSYAVWNYTDLSHAYRSPWKFEPIPDSAMERIVREEKAGK